MIGRQRILGEKNKYVASCQLSAQIARASMIEGFPRDHLNNTALPPGKVLSAVVGGRIDHQDLKRRQALLYQCLDQGNETITSVQGWDDDRGAYVGA